MSQQNLELVQGALVWTVRDGLIELVEVFGDQREALRAVGLAQ